MASEFLVSQYEAVAGPSMSRDPLVLAEMLVRLATSFTLTPDGVVAVVDDNAVREFATSYLVPCCPDCEAGGDRRQGAWPRCVSSGPARRASRRPRCCSPVTRYGLPEPDRKVLAAHPTVSDDILTRVGHGDIVVKPNIARFDGSDVVFADGSREEVDAVIYRTGYRITFPFLADDIVPTMDNEVTLYQRVVPVNHPGLYFLGLIQPLGAIMPLAEAQAHWIADLIEGTAALPAVNEMDREIRRYRERMRRRYVASKRHTIEVDFQEYLADLKRLRRMLPSSKLTGTGS